MAGGKLKKLFSVKSKNPDVVSNSGKPPSYTSQDPNPSPMDFNYAASTTTVNTTTSNRLSYSILKGIPEYQPAPAQNPVHRPVPNPIQATNSTPTTPEHSGSRLASFGFGGGSSKPAKPTSPVVNGISGATGGAAPARTAPPDGTSADEVRRATKLLRHMFELRMSAWTMQGAHISDEHRRIEKERRADQVLVDIQSLVQGWQNASAGAGEKGAWSEEEFQEVLWIASTLADPTWKFGQGVGGETPAGNDEQPVWAAA